MWNVVRGKKIIRLGDGLIEVNVCGDAIRLNFAVFLELITHTASVVMLG